MQTVILAAGRGTRMGGVTDEVPKPLLEVAGKTLLEHKFEVLPEEIDEIILIVGYRGEMIQRRFADAWRGKRLRYIEQEVLDGTAGALWRAKDMLANRFVVMNGDDLYAGGDVRACLKTEHWVMLVQASEHIRSGNVILEKGVVCGIEEGDFDKKGVTNTGLFVLDTRVFDAELVPKASGSREFGLPQTALAASKKSGIPLHAIPATFWLQITAPEDLAVAESLLEKNPLQIN